MALPEFIDNATSLDDGVANKLAGNLSKLRTAKNKMDSITQGVASEFETLDSGNLPDLPTVFEIQNKAIEINSTVGETLTDLSALNDLTGGCLDSALGAATEIAKDGLGFISDALSAFTDINDMPADSVMNKIYEIYAKAQEFANSLGIAELVADINGLLGCDSASSLVDDVNSEVFSIMTAMGLSTDGTPDSTSYYNKMWTELSEYGTEAGIPTTFTDNMSDALGELTAQTNAMATQAKDAAQAQIASVKENIKANVPKTPTPPSFF